MSQTILLLSGDLVARDRLDRAVPGDTILPTTTERLRADLETRSPDALVVDLDTNGHELAAIVSIARELGLPSEKIVGYFSHVNEDAQRAASDAGIAAVTRGRFWTDPAAHILGE